MGQAKRYGHSLYPPHRNADIERFNQRFREERLDQYLFKTLDDLGETVHGRRIQYHQQRHMDLIFREFDTS